MRQFNYFLIAKKFKSPANELLLHAVGAIGKFKNEKKIF